MKKKATMIDNAEAIGSHIMNGFGVIGLTYIVCNDITLQDILSWLM